MESLIAAEFSGAEIEVVGDKPKNLGKLWDFNAEELPEDARNDDSPHARKGRRGFSGTLFKTDGFLKAHPFGTVPVPDGASVFSNQTVFCVLLLEQAATKLIYTGEMASKLQELIVFWMLVWCSRERRKFIFCLSSRCPKRIMTGCKLPMSSI